jgi:protein associated with RNAse G/E
MNEYFRLDGARSALETGTLRAEQGKSWRSHQTLTYCYFSSNIWYYMVDIRKKTEEYYMEVAFVK